MSLSPVSMGLLALAAALAFIYATRYRQHPAEVYVPMAAWLRAAIYFCFCLLVADVSGALEAALQRPPVSDAECNSPLWWLATLALFAFILLAYWGYWARNTLRFGRQLDIVPQFVFGLTWGITSGLYFLALWHIAGIIGDGWANWAVGVLAYLMISLWQMFWMDMYWDVYVSPEHDTPASIREKVPRTHIPNMTFCMVYFVIYENYAVFIALQTLALLAASFGMRMPAPWCTKPTPPARRVPGLFGLPRAGGYVEGE